MSQSVYEVRVEVMPRPDVLDPQGRAVEGALAALGFAEFGAVRVGKVIHFRVRVEAATPAEAVRARVEDACRRLLANPVIETWTIDIEPFEATE